MQSKRRLNFLIKKILIILNVWANYKNSWGPHEASFPWEYKVKDEITVCNNQDELLDCIVNEFWTTKQPDSKALLYELGSKVDLKLIWDARVHDMINRFQYCKKFNVPPYPGAYDGQPVEWVNFCNTFQNELGKLNA